MNPHGPTLSRRAALKTLGAGTLAALAFPALPLRADDEKLDRLRRNLPWLNQVSGPRPPFVWENHEDLIYHDLSYHDPAIDHAPEFCAFLRRVWVFNRAMQWRRDEARGTIVAWSAGGDLWLTGERQVSAWHSDPDNALEHKGATTRFTKKSTRRRRDCAVLPAFQFHLGQHPTLRLTVREVNTDWQFVISVKGRSGPPLLASTWRSGPADITFDIAAELRRRGYTNEYAELHFVMGLWCPDATAERSVTFEAHLVGQPAVVGALPVIRTESESSERGLPLTAVVVSARGELLRPADGVKVHARLGERRIPLLAVERLWKGNVRYLKPGNYEATLVVEGAVTAQSTLQLRVTDGAFDAFDKARGWILRDGRPAGPLSGAFQGAFFFRDAGTTAEKLINGQKDWDAWDRDEPPGEHLHYWEALTDAELDERFAYLARCGWDLLHLCQHWGVWERLDAGGCIAPHGAEQLARYLRAADRHGLKAFFALTHYEYSLHEDPARWSGTAPSSRYVEAGFKDRDWFTVGHGPFDRMFRQYLSDFVSLFKDETALCALSASGEGDAHAGPRVQDIFRQVRAQDTHHLFVAEPIHRMTQLPRAHCEGWEQNLFGSRTYWIGTEHFPEFDLGVEFKFARLGRLFLAEGSFPGTPRYARFRHELAGHPTKPQPWTGTLRYRLRLRDTLYLGLVHRLPILMFWDEQVAEDEHRLFKRIVQSVNWNQPWLEPPVAIRVDSSSVTGEGRGKLVRYERALAGLPLACQYVEADAPKPPGVQAVFDARAAWEEPRFQDIGGSLPESLRREMPVRVSDDYCASYLWSADRTTLLAYCYNTSDHSKIEPAYDLSGLWHRTPQPGRCELGLRNLPGTRLHYQVFDLSSHVLLREGSAVEGLDLPLGQTDKDFFILVTPR